MSRLREVIEAAGFSRVRTYIQSGNVIVDTDRSADATENRVHELIKEHLGPDIVVIARTATQLKEALEGNPFKTGYDISRVFFVSFASPPPADKIVDLLSRDISPEKLAFGKMAAYMYIPGQYGKGTLSGNYLEKKLGVAATMRNFNTMNRLMAMNSAE
jgi:uncharacterized protein (DUF1697 family)